MTWLRFATHNVCELPLHYSTIGRTIATALRDNDVVMWQELSDNRYEAALKRHRGYAHDTPGPVHNDARLSVARPLKLTGGGVRQFQPEKAGVSHERFVTWSLVQGLDSDVIVSSRHYWPSDRPVQLRGAHADVALLAEHARQTGLPQVASGDFNMTTNVFPKRIGGYAVHSFHNGLDWMHFIDGQGYKWRFPLARRTLTRRTASDHPVLIVKARLVRR